MCPGAYNYCFEVGINSTCAGVLVENDLNGVPQRHLYYSGPNPIFLIDPPCGDCTTFSSNIVPPFWQ